MNSPGAPQGGEPAGEAPSGADAAPQPPRQADGAQDGGSSQAQSPDAGLSGEKTPSDAAQAPDGQPQAGETPLSGEAVTISITPEMTVSVLENGERAAASFSDIAVGDLVLLTYAEDGETVTGITVQRSESSQPAAAG